MLSPNLNRIGVVIVKKGSWRETVIHYAKMKDRVHHAVNFYDKLIKDGWVEAWAALRAVDEVCCADMIMNEEAIDHTKFMKMH